MISRLAFVAALAVLLLGGCVAYEQPYAYSPYYGAPYYPYYGGTAFLGFFDFEDEHHRHFDDDDFDHDHHFFHDDFDHEHHFFHPGACPPMGCFSSHFR